MMSKKQWLVLLCLFVIYLLLGASLFFYIENNEERKRNEVDKEEKKKIEGLLKKYYIGNMNHTQMDIFRRLTEYCGKPLSPKMSEIDNPQKWDFYHSLFFVITVVSTIGYGNLAPTTMFTRIFMIFYGLIGIPINGIVMVTLGDFFGKSFTKLYQRWKTSKMHDDTARLGLIGQIILYLVPGFTFFIFLPSVFIAVFEEWEYDVAVYYAFVTLTTIGFGDKVAGVEDSTYFGPFWHTIYQIFLLVWIIGGLGYVVMVLGFISQGMRSKKMVQFEQKLRENILKTPQKIRRELRSLLHEFLFLRVKPVYKGDFEYVPTILERSQSCPDLTIYRNLNSPTMVRKRAHSECYRHLVLQRIQSDTDLQRIDRERTFSTAGILMEQKNLLLKVVDALSQSAESIESSDYGFDMFSEKEILASEQYGSNWSIGNKSVVLPPPQRRRAVSDIRSPIYLMEQQKSMEQSWYGDGAVEAFNEMKMRARTFSAPADTLKPQAQGIIQKIRNRFKSNKDDKFDVESQAVDAEVSNKKRGSIFSNHEEYIKQTMRGRASILSAKNESVLEQTSIADFIRALSAITVPEAVTPKSTSKVSAAPVTPKRTRRLPIKTSILNRRSSLMPPTSIANQDKRRFSLRPVEENLLAPPPYTPSLSRQQTPRGSIRNPSRRKFSSNTTTGLQLNVTSPVERKVIRKEKDDN